MIHILIILAYFSTATAIAGWGIFGVVIATRKVIHTEESLKNLNQQLASCRRCSFLFILLCWLAASGKPWDECVSLYMELSDVCLRLSVIWFASALAQIVVSALVGLLNKGGGFYHYVNKIRLPGFLYGSVFLILSYLLDLS